MIRGTTPTHTFTIPISTTDVKTVKISYAQNDEVVVEKLTEDCVFENNTIVTILTQEDTFKFDCKKPVQIQLRILTNEGTALASVIEKVGVSQLLDNEVLT